MTALLIITACLIVCILVLVWFLIFIRVADLRTPKQGRIEPEKPWPAPPAPPGLCTTCGKDMARLEATDSLRDLTFNGRRIYSITLYSDLSGEFTLREARGGDIVSLIRFGEDGSDVYVFYTSGGTLECCGCSQVGRSVNCGSEREMLNHLLVHRERGDCVPMRVIDELRE